MHILCMDKYIIYDNTPWEEQFLSQDLLKVDFRTYNKLIRTNKELNYSDMAGWEKLDNISDIIGNNVFIFTSNLHKYPAILSMVKLLKPTIIVHLSDEWGSKEEYQGLHKHTKLVLRQYHHIKYYRQPNIKYIPLGYMNGMLEANYMDLQLKLPSERKYKWSFIGRVKKDRAEMLRAMSSIIPHRSGGAQKKDMRDIYRDSVFVPNGRGNVKLDCFRLYEASLCGAIPIVVGSKKEIEETFCEEENPPWLMFQSWDEAQLQCSELLKDMDYLNELSQKNVDWWRNRVAKLSELIKVTLMESS